MNQRVDFITLGVPDVASARRFYVDGLGWRPVLEVEGEVVFLQVNHGLLLALWGAAELEADVAGAGAARPSAPAGQAPFALAHNVASDEAVAATLAQAEEAGGTILKPAQPAFFGGVQGYFADPAGFRWEVAHNPGWRVDPDGRVDLGPA